MKILVTLTFYHPHWTGLTAYAKRMAEGLAARGHQVTVLTSQHAPELPREEHINGVRVIRLPYVARVSRGVIMPAFPATAARLIAEHDIVQVHTPMLMTDLPSEIYERMKQQTPLGYVAEPEEIAGPVVFLASDHARYITGATLNVSGGFLMY